MAGNFGAKLTVLETRLHNSGGNPFRRCGVPSDIRTETLEILCLISPFRHNDSGCIDKVEF